jgi:hypothetical protein
MSSGTAANCCSRGKARSGLGIAIVVQRRCPPVRPNIVMPFGTVFSPSAWIATERALAVRLPADAVPYRNQPGYRSHSRRVAARTIVERRHQQKGPVRRWVVAAGIQENGRTSYQPSSRAAIPAATADRSVVIEISTPTQHRRFINRARRS